jgi:radical SAM protein with 4Fe4S-binding SPASM domain
MQKAGLFQSIHDKAARKKIPISCHFDLTHHCNLKCIHCYVVHDDRPELSTSEIKSILEQIAEEGTLYLTFSGGEILSRKDFFEIAAHARKLHFVIRLITNATLLDAEAAARIAALHINQVNISIYGSTSEIHDRITTVEGSFLKSLKAIELLVKHGVSVRIGCVLMKQNINDYRNIFAMAEKMGVLFQADHRLTPKNNGDISPMQYRISDDDIEKVFSDPSFHQPPDMHDQIKYDSAFSEIPCGASHMTFTISPYGDIYPCVQLPINCGNLKEQSFHDIWYHSQEMIRIRSFRVPDIPECAACSVRKFCTYCIGLARIEAVDISTPSKRFCTEAGILSKLREGKQQ